MGVFVPVALIGLVEEFPCVGLFVSAFYEDDVVVVVNVIGGFDLECFRYYMTCLSNLGSLGCHGLHD